MHKLNKTESRILREAALYSDGTFTLEMISGKGKRELKACLNLVSLGLAELIRDDSHSFQAFDGRGNKFGNTRGSRTIYSRILTIKIKSE
jgi:hypothetical protein